MAWRKTKNVGNLERQLDERWPNRDRTSDGTKGDAAHQGTTSGHNPDDTAGSRPAWDGDPDNLQEVRAKDTDADLRDPDVTAQMLVDHLRRLPGFASVCRYLIFNRKLYHARNGFEPQEYTGANDHSRHIHYEGAWSQAADDNDRFDFKLRELGMAEMDLTDAAEKAVAAETAGRIGTDLDKDVSGVAKGVRKQVKTVVDAALAEAVPMIVQQVTASVASAFQSLGPVLVQAVGDAAEGANAQEVRNIVADTLRNTRLEVGS